MECTCADCAKEATHHILVAEKFGYLCDDHFNEIGETCLECDFYSGGHIPPQCDFFGFGISYDLEDVGCKHYVPEWLYKKSYRTQMNYKKKLPGNDNNLRSGVKS